MDNSAASATGEVESSNRISSFDFADYTGETLGKHDLITIQEFEYANETSKVHSTHFSSDEVADPPDLGESHGRAANETNTALTLNAQHAHHNAQAETTQVPAVPNRAPPPPPKEIAVLDRASDVAATWKPNVEQHGISEASLGMHTIAERRKETRSSMQYLLDTLRRRSRKNIQNIETPRISLAEEYGYGSPKFLETRLFKAAKSELFYTIPCDRNPDKPKTGILNLCTLQHLELRRMQADLANYASALYKTGPERQGVSSRQLLREYCEAVRNLDFMKECALRGYDEDPFILKTSRELDRAILQNSGLVPHLLDPMGQLPPTEDYENTQLRTQGRNRANNITRARSRTQRLGLAALGGLSLIGPMLIMANVPGKVASLTTTCVSMAIFVVFIAFLTELGPNEVLATTAAYAAVLVVFVGTSLNGGGRFGQ